jgi:hypothetical protein
MNAQPPTDMLSSGQTLANQVRTTIEPYERYVGRSVLDLPTPALVIDLEAAERNLRRMADFDRISRSTRASTPPDFRWASVAPTASALRPSPKQP